MDRSAPDRFLGMAPEASSSSRRSRSPIARDLDNPEGLPEVLVVARPRIRGCPTPIPPTPRPVISGQKTPAPPKAKPKSGLSRAPELVSSSAAPVPVIEIPDNPPLELCKLHKASAGLNEVLLWLTQAIGLGYRHIISLDQHHVADRCVSQTREVLQVVSGPDRFYSPEGLRLHKGIARRQGSQQFFHLGKRCGVLRNLLNRPSTAPNPISASNRLTPTAPTKSVKAFTSRITSNKLTHALNGNIIWFEPYTSASQLFMGTIVLYS